MAFEIPSVNMFQQPVNGAGAVSAGGAGVTRGAGSAGFSGVKAGGATPFQKDWGDFQASIANWGGSPNYRPGERVLDFSA